MPIAASTPRLSRYTIASPVPGSDYVLLLHGLTGNLSLLRGAAYADLAAGLPAPPELRRDLLGLGFLTELSEAEEERTARAVAADLHPQARERHPGSFVFIPTYVCSFRCPYCFQGHRLHKKPSEEDAGRYMSERQVEAAFRVVETFRERHPGHRYRHMLFGGEPLQADTLPTVERIVRECRERGDTLRAISNGYELDRFESLLGPEGIASVQITLDGTKAIHDQRRFAVVEGSSVVPRDQLARRTVEKLGSYDRILENVKLALERGTRINVRTNLDRRNRSCIAELQAELEDLKSHARNGRLLSFALSVVHPVPTPRGPRTSADHIPIAEAVDEMGPLTIYYQRAAALLDQLMDDDKPHPFRSMANCSSQVGTYVFDPRGDVYACYEQAGRVEKRVGVYDESGMRLDGVRMGEWHGRHPGAIEECGRCKYIFICKGGCAAHADTASGTMYANHCEGMREYMPQVLGRAFQELRA